MSQYKFIEDALRLESPIIIGALKKELENDTDDQKPIDHDKIFERILTDLDNP